MSQSAYSLYSSRALRITAVSLVSSEVRANIAKGCCFFHQNIKNMMIFNRLLDSFAPSYLTVYSLASVFCRFKAETHLRVCQLFGGVWVIMSLFRVI